MKIDDRVISVAYIYNIDIIKAEMFHRESYSCVSFSEKNRKHS